jgi:two-component sensor histidine kinase
VTGRTTGIGHGSPFDALGGRFRKALTLLAVQAWRSSDIALREELSSLADRIRRVVDRYEGHRGSGVRTVDAANYLERLQRSLLAAANCERQRIGLAITSDVGELSIEGALVVGLIVSELVATALAQAGANRLCRVTMRIGGDLSAYVLTAANQRRKRRETIFPDPEGIGMGLVRQLVWDLGGTFTTVNNGAAVEIRLSLGERDLASPLRNISPRRTLDRAPGYTLSSKEGRHELRYS